MPDGSLEVGSIPSDQKLCADPSQLFSLIFRPHSALEPAFAQFFSAPDKKHKSSAPPNKALLPVDYALTWIAGALLHCNNNGLHFYYRPALRNAKGDVIGSHCAWLDLDFKDNPDGKKMLAEFSPAPTWVFMSGAGIHAIWLFEAFCHDPKLVESINLAIAKRLKGDTKAARVNMGIRVPGNVNWKYITPGVDVEMHTCQAIPGGTGLPVPIASLPDLEQSAKKRLGKPADFRSLYLHYFPDVKDPAADKWNVLCPFHDDKSPSMVIFMERGNYACSAGGCNAKGTAISFVARKEEISWREARGLVDHLKVRASMIDMIEQHLRAACNPLYREGHSIVVRTNNGKRLTLHAGSRSHIIANLQVLLDGSPAMQISDAVDDDAGTDEINKMLVEAALQLGQNLPDVSGLVLLGEGIHYLKDEKQDQSEGWRGRVLRVSGGQMSRWDIHMHEWYPVSEIPYADRFVPFAPEHAPVAWHPASVDPDYSKHPEVVWGVLRQALACWYLDRPSTWKWLAAYTIYLMHWQLFDTVIHFQISGVSQSGKSTIAEGWFTGKQPGSVGMVPGARYLTNASAASIYQAYDKSRLPIVLDEVGDFENKRTQAMIELVRTMESGGGTVTRGSTEGRQIVYDVMFPTIWSGIKVPDMIQDVNRRFHVDMPRMEVPQPDGTMGPPRNPWQRVAEEIGKDTMQAVSAAIQDLLPRHIDQVLERLSEVETVMRGVSGDAYRMSQRLMPLLAIMALCGEDVREMAEDMRVRVAEVEAAAAESSPSEILRQSLLHRNIRVPGYDGETTLANELGANGHIDFNALSHGLYYWKAERVVGVVVARLSQVVPEWSATNLARTLRTVPGFMGSEPRTAGGVRTRFALIDADVLLMGSRTGGESEQPAPTAEEMKPA